MKNVPIGLSDFEEIIENNYYYVDKTFLIKALIDQPGQVSVITRPRRFGKSLNLSMVQYFFEKKQTSKINLFDDLIISSFPEYMKHQGKYPLISLTFKDIKKETWKDCLALLRTIISDEFRRHDYLLESPAIDKSEKKLFQQILDKKTSILDFENSLKLLTDYLFRHHSKKVIILIDEYDVPVSQGIIHSYAEQISDFMKTFLGAALKGNTNLELAVLIGIYNIKEITVDAINNIQSCTLFDNCFTDLFGYTSREVNKILGDLGLTSFKKKVKLWYQGYLIGSHEIFNPWSINNFVKSKKFDSYWVKTGDSNEIDNLLQETSTDNKKKLQELILGHSITTEIEDIIAFQDPKKYSDALWSYLMSTGYLSRDNDRIMNQKKVADFFIPNKEISSIYKTIIDSWFKRTETSDFPQMINSLTRGHVEEFKRLFRIIAKESFKFFDPKNGSPEQFYLSFILSIISGLSNDYIIETKDNMRFGVYGVFLNPKNKEAKRIIIFFKIVENSTLFESKANAFWKACIKNLDLRLRGNCEKTIYIAVTFEGDKIDVIEIP